MQKPSYKFPFLVIVIFLNVVADQLTKIVVRKEMAYNQVIEIFGKYFILTKVENTGAFLSAGNNLPEFIRIILLSALPVLVLLYGCWFLFKHPALPKLTQLGIAFLIGGGIGNVFDRIAYGSVTDFLFMDFVIFRTGVFNIADMAIMAGIGMLLWQSFKKSTP